MAPEITIHHDNQEQKDARLLSPLELEICQHTNSECESILRRKCNIAAKRQLSLNQVCSLIISLITLIILQCKLVDWYQT